MNRDKGRITTLGTVAILALAIVAVCAGVLWWYVYGRSGHILDEALSASPSRDASSFSAADEDYFHDMDQDRNGPVALSREEIQGRNTWLVWTGGNDRLWEVLGNKSAGALDFVKVLSSHPSQHYGRHDRWQYFGLVNEPCFEQAAAPDPQRWNLWLDKRKAGCEPDPFENATKYPGVRIGSRGSTVNGKPFDAGSYYGYATGIVGFRLFPNPAFDDRAAARWDAERFYTDRSYYEDKTLVRPYRVGMSCALCHVGPNPVNPPADPNNPAWANLSSNVGAQYFWVDRIFFQEADFENFAFQLFHSSRPGSLDTSFVSTDNINNPRTMNAVYLLGPRLLHAKRWGKEQLKGGGLDNHQFNDYLSEGPLAQLFQRPDVVWTPRVLKDGADSVGAMGALNRVYVNIGTFSEEWLTHFNALVGGQPITPIRIAVARENSAYFKATEAQTFNTARFFLKTTAAHHLADAPGGQQYMTTDENVLTRGKAAFAENCARCHSSKLPPTIAALDPDGCAGKDYLTCWNKYWAWTQTPEFRQQMRDIVMKADFLQDNYLSSEFRVPVTVLQTNACSPLATNAIARNIWDNFSSQSYKDLPSVGTITWYHPYTGEARTYTMPAGGRGYTRPPSLISLWSTAPFLLNNTVGDLDPSNPKCSESAGGWYSSKYEECLNPAPSVAKRLEAFQDGIEKMLWPDKRDKDALLGDKIPGKIDRTTQSSYLKISYGYLPDALQNLRGFSRFFPWLVDDKDKIIKIGPIPAGTPVGLLTNVNPFSESSNPGERLVHGKKLLDLVLKINNDLQKLPPGASDEDAKKVFAPLVDPLLELSKCPDLIVNRGHYFGTGQFSGGEPGLSDADKRALIAFLKRL